MTYRITNRSHQEGMIALDGHWQCVLPGQSLDVSATPGEHTQNIIVRRLIDVVEQSEGIKLPQSNVHLREVSGKKSDQAEGASPESDKKEAK